ncbi:MAG: hypothetical protein KDA24_05455 [Deltaproteobacteria bacterium]|nr:hypothetical protein [Deltaproteobacteria bacterium]
MRIRLLLISLAVFALLPALAGGRSERAVTWSQWERGKSDVRKGVFTVGDSQCAYTSMADPKVMGKVLPHLEDVLVHADDGVFQDVTLVERFFPVGTVESRYHRSIDGTARLEWKLIKGRQAKHDGFWQVHPSGKVEFENAIEAKSILHRALLRSIQVRAMEGVAESIQEHCGK